MRIKTTIVAYAFSVQCFENATIVAYVGLRVKYITMIYLFTAMHTYISAVKFVVVYKTCNNKC